jgi:hypothetical protein
VTVQILGTESEKLQESPVTSTLAPYLVAFQLAIPCVPESINYTMSLGSAEAI